MKRDVFTYGSLMFPEVWSLVVEGRHRAVAATLADHARWGIAGESYPGTVPQPGSQVAGVLHLDVDEADLERLDRFEGDDYRRVSVTVTVTDGDGAVHAADTYLYLRIDRLLASPWSPDAFAMQRFIDTYCRDRLDP